MTTSLPASLGPSFTVGAGRAAGLGRRRLDGPGLHRPARGLRAAAAATSIVEHAHQLQPLLPESAAFSHLTAARLHGLWLPTRWSPTEPVDVLHPTSTPRLRRPGIRSHPVRTPRGVTRAHGLPVTTAADTWADLAEQLALDDLVVLGDSVVRFRSALGTTAQLELSCARLRRGGPRARDALRLVRPGSASAMETRTRLLVVRAGLPPPELNGRVLDSSGRYLGCFDLVWRSARVIVEYDGDQHRTDRDQYERDHHRLRQVTDEGWVVIVLRAGDVFRTPDETVARIARALTRGEPRA